MKLLIVGQGLAGSCLAWEALRSGIDFEVMSDPARDPRASSRVAGGSCHPISGPRFTPHWKGMEFLAAADSLYREISRSIGREVWVPLPTSFFFEGEESRARWEKRVESFSEHGIPWSSLPAPDQTSGLRRDSGGVSSTAGGALDLGALVDGTRAHLQHLGLWREGFFEPESLESLPSVEGPASGWSIAGKNYDRIALCLGRFILESPSWAARAPWGRTQGETFEVQADRLPQDGIWKRKMALIPQGRGRFRLSATFKRIPADSSDEAPTAQGREKLDRSLREMLENPEESDVRVISHQAGVRLHVRDHLPCVGGGKGVAPGITILNGLGSKGVLWTPLCARWLIRAILTGDSSEIPAEVRADRFSHRVGQG